MFVQGSEDREVGDHGGLLIRRCDCFRVNPIYWSPLHHEFCHVERRGTHCAASTIFCSFLHLLVVHSTIQTFGLVVDCFTVTTLAIGISSVGLDCPYQNAARMLLIWDGVSKQAAADS